MKKMDFTQFGPSGPPDNSNKGATNKKWWLQPKKNRYESVIAIIKSIVDKDSPRQTQLHISSRLYGNVSMLGLNGLSYTKVADAKNSIRDRVTYNLCQSVIDTIVAKMSKNKPKPLYLTSGGDYKIMRKAKKLDRFNEGLFHENQAYKIGPLTLRDAEVWGTGVVHVFEKYNRVAWERVHCSEIYVDTIDSIYGKPRQLHRVKTMDRDVLIDMFPDKKSEILTCNSASSELKGVYENVADLVSVAESWHLPSGPEAKDGLHMITIENAELFSEKWTRAHFPFVFLNSSSRLYGFWGQGACERLQSIQLEINKLLWVIQRSMHLHGTYRVWIKTGSKLPKEHINNDIGAVLVSDEPPQYLSAPFIPNEYFSHLATLKQAGYEQEGVSQLSAAAKKPEGLNSGKAIREYTDNESDRFTTLSQAYEQFFLDLSKRSIEIIKEIFDREGKYAVKIPGKRFLDTVDWKEIDLEDDQYEMQCFPVSSLPDDPSGRLQTIQEYIQAGYLSPRQGRRLLDFPDLDQVENLANSREEYQYMVLDKIVDGGEYTIPEPEDDLQMANEITLQYYSQGKCQGLEPDRLEMLRRYRDQVNLLIQKASAPAPQPGIPGAPTANPLPTPTSDLVPNGASAQAS